HAALPLSRSPTPRTVCPSPHATHRARDPPRHPATGASPPTPTPPTPGRQRASTRRPTGRAPPATHPPPRTTPRPTPRAGRRRTRPADSSPDPSRPARTRTRHYERPVTLRRVRSMGSRRGRCMQVGERGSSSHPRGRERSGSPLLVGELECDGGVVGSRDGHLDHRAPALRRRLDPCIERPQLTQHPGTEVQARLREGEAHEPRADRVPQVEAPVVAQLPERSS